MFSFTPQSGQLRISNQLYEEGKRRKSDKVHSRERQGSSTAQDHQSAQEEDNTFD